MTGLLARTIRLDASDTVVFAEAAPPGDWAVTGGFLFAGRDPEAMGRKERIAFRTGFVGVSAGANGFGFSTLAVVSEASAAERAAAVEALAAGLVAWLGAPDLAVARPAAAEEVAYAAGLCRGHAVGTLIALHREATADGAMRERFRTLRPRAQTALGGAAHRGHAKAFFAVETDEDAPREPPVDLVALLRGRAR